MPDPIRCPASAPAGRRGPARPSTPPGVSPAESRPLPPFLSPEPPRSEGEALLRRIFTRSARMS